MRPANAKTQPIGATPGISTKILEPRPLTGFTRRFADLRVRPKLMVLHNFFFLILTCAVYFTVINLIAARIEQARSREITLILNSFTYLSQDNGQDELRPYDLRTGNAGEFGLTDDARQWMQRFPGRTWQRVKTSEHIFKLIPQTDRFYRLTLPSLSTSRCSLTSNWASSLSSASSTSSPSSSSNSSSCLATSTSPCASC